MTFAMVDRSLPAGLRGYLPSYQWACCNREKARKRFPLSVCRTEHEDRADKPMTDTLATDGFNLRAGG